MRSPWAIPNDPRMHEPPGVGEEAATGSAPTSGDPVRPARTPRIHEVVGTPDGPGRIQNVVLHQGRVTTVLVLLDHDREQGRYSDRDWRAYDLEKVEYSAR